MQLIWNLEGLLAVASLSVFVFSCGNDTSGTATENGERQGAGTSQGQDSGEGEGAPGEGESAEGEGDSGPGVEGEGEENAPCLELGGTCANPCPAGATAATNPALTCPATGDSCCLPGEEGEGSEGEGSEGEGVEGEGEGSEGEGSCAAECTGKCDGAPDGCGGTCTAACPAGKTCQNQTCLTCGGVNAPCCPNDACNPGLACQAGVCQGAVSVKWIAVPSGSFSMGCSPNDSLCLPEENPVHEVAVAAFEITETEVTQEQYAAVMGTNPSSFNSCQKCPVEQVTWDEAKAFCQAAGGRLPSEAEWEYAARGGTTSAYVCGDINLCLGATAWFGANAGNQTHAVKGKSANPFGLYDVLGNVAEWVEDCWHADYSGAPATGEVWSGGDCNFIAVRGSSWKYRYNDTLRVSFRNTQAPSARNDDLGFRCAK